MTGAGILRNYAPAAILLMVILCIGISPCSAGTRLYPVDGGSVTSGQGWRIDPFGSGRWVFHRGLDIAVPVGTPVHPTQIGTVVFAGDYKGYGKLVVVEHGNSYVTLYGHNSEIRVAPGQKVDTATVLALSGNTGHSTGPHVHYEVRRLQEQSASAGMRSELEGLVRKRIDGWVGSIVAGQGGGESAEMQTVPERNRQTSEPPGLVP
jgi:murein DD-endopeptidase MepM/ murein hydrolase activator NlpD